MYRNVAKPAKIRRFRARIARSMLVLLTASAVLVAVPAAAPAQTGSDQPLQEVPITGSASAFVGTANSANARFLVDAYQQLLGRAADVDGLDFQLARLTSGGDRSRLTVIYSLLFSAEGARQEVGRAYGDLLSRAADLDGDGYWTTHLQGNGVLDLRVLLMASDEYVGRAGGTTTGWVEALYGEILGRSSDTGGLQYWSSLADGGTPRPLIVAGMYLSDEALARRVTAYYNETLSRPPTAAEQAAGITTIRTLGERYLRSQIWSSDEHYEQYLDAALS